MGWSSRVGAETPSGKARLPLRNQSTHRGAGVFLQSSTGGNMWSGVQRMRPKVRPRRLIVKATQERREHQEVNKGEGHRRVTGGCKVRMESRSGAFGGGQERAGTRKPQRNQ